MPRKRDESVRLTWIYTRGGDAGETSLGTEHGSPSSTSESAPMERWTSWNAALGVMLAGDCPDEIRDVLA